MQGQDFALYSLYKRDVSLLFFNLIYTIIKQFIEGLKEERAKKSEQDETNQNEKL